MAGPGSLVGGRRRSAGKFDCPKHSQAAPHHSECTVPITTEHPAVIGTVQLFQTALPINADGGSRKDT